MSWVSVFEFIAVPYVFLLLVLEDLGFEPETGTHAHSGDIHRAKTVLSQSFRFGIHRWPQYLGDIQHADPRKNVDIDLYRRIYRINMLTT